MMNEIGEREENTHKHFDSHIAQTTENRDYIYIACVI